MSRKKGTVTSVGKSQYSYFIQLDGDQFYYNTKFEPKCGKDDVVGITFTKTDEKRGNISKVEILEKNSSGYKPTSSASSYVGSQRAGGDNRQESIVYQSSRKDALQLAVILLTADAFATKGKPDAKRVQIEALIDELTARLFKDAIDPKNSGPLKAESSSDDEEKEGWDGDEKDEDDSWEKEDTWDD